MDTNQSSCLIIDIDQTFHYHYGIRGMGFVWGGSIEDRAMSAASQGGIIFVAWAAVLPRRANQPSRSKTQQPSVDAPQESVQHPHSLHGISTVSYKKPHWRYSGVVGQLVDRPAWIPWCRLLLEQSFSVNRASRAHTCVEMNSILSSLHFQTVISLRVNSFIFFFAFV